MDYRYGIALGVKVTLAIDDEGLRFKQGLKKISIPWSEVVCFGVRKREASMGIVASELLVKQAGANGRTRVRNIPLDPSAEPCQQALADLRARCSPEADTTSLPWEQAAERLGVVARPWYESFLKPKVTLGIVIIGASLVAAPVTRQLMPPANQAESIGYVIATLIGIGVGVELIRRGRRG